MSTTIFVGESRQDKVGKFEGDVVHNVYGPYWGSGTHTCCHGIVQDETWHINYPAGGPGGLLQNAWGFGSWNTALTAVPHPAHSIAGALAGAIVAVELYKAARGIRGSTGVIWVGPIVLGIAVGRLGCLFAGLPDETYGIPTTLLWGVELGDGIVRHPVQLYESLAMLAFLAFYLVALARRARWTEDRAFYLFILFYAAQRFCWEFLKPYPRLLGPLDLFQLLAAAMILYALVLDGYARRHRHA